MARLLLLVILLAFASLAEATVVISEVLADPPTGAAGDANQDGQRDAREDEFIELYNAGSASVDISGWQLGDSTSPDNFFQFPANTVIEPGSYVVLFGGGNPSGFTVPVYTDDGTIGNGLKNSGESIHLIDDTDTEVAVVSHDPWPKAQSIVRNPPDGDVFEPHKTASPTGEPFSPGRATDAEPETSETPEPETPEPETSETPEPETSETPSEPIPTYALCISEVLADPPTGAAGDANQDGQRDGYEDEFVELYNAGSASVDISGWRLGDSTPSDNFFQFPSDAVIEPDSYIVLFGGGNPTGFTIPVYIDDGKIGSNGLTNKGEDIHLIDDTGDTVAVVSHSPWPTKQSLVRHPPDGDEWVAHKIASTIKALFSPGHTHIIPKPSYPLFISEVLADPPSDLAGDANRDGRRDTYEDEFVELYNAGEDTLSLAGWRLGDSTSPDKHFQFPANAVIESGSYVVLFGGGNPTGFTVPVYTDDGKIGNGLTGKGEEIRLIDDNGHEIAIVSHTPWPTKQSLVRHPPGSDALVAHKIASTVKALFSPGHTHIIPKPDYPLFISEVLADPPNGLAGDANRDGVRDTYQDEFVELYNAGPVPISLAGWRLGDSTVLKNHFQFPPDAVIEPNSYIVLFGGGTPSGFTVPVYTDDGKIGNGLTGKGEEVRLIDDNGHEIDVVSHSPWPSKQSLVRNPSDGGLFVPHKTASTTKALFSPGHTHIIPKPDYPLFISEILADPPSGLAGDANRDGVRDTYEDEFIELYNAGSVPISLAGWRLGDSTSLKNHFRFPADAVIAPHSYIVLFGGGNPTGFTFPVYTDDGKIGNGLTGKGEEIRLIDDNGHEIDVVSHDDWPSKQSLVRTPADGGAFVPHKTASPIAAPFSPGHASETRPVLTYPLFISEVLADPPGDANRDGQHDPHEDEFIELYNAGPVPISLAGWRLGDAGSLSGYFRFPAKAVIAPRSYVVLFGGGNPLGFTIPVYTDDGTIGDGLTNSGESIHLINDHGYEATSIFHATWPNAQSLVRIPSDGEAFTPHKTASPTEAPFSPGHAPATRPALTYPLFICEVLADPPSGTAGDANRDGQRDGYQDEFIELYNAGPIPVSLAGWRLGDAGSLSDYFRFPPDAVIEPDSYLVLFGGGNPVGFTVPVYTDDGTIGDGLTDTGESIHLINDRGDEVSFFSHSTWPDDQSLVRTPPDDGAFVPHKMASQAKAPFSPGYAPEPPTELEKPKTPPRPTYSLFISEVLADPPEGPAGDANQDGHYDPHEDEFVELYNAGVDTISLASWQLGDTGSLLDYFRFPPGAFIAPGSYAILFGGGNPVGFTVPVYTDDGTIGNGLTNTGEAIYLIDKTSRIVARVSHDDWPDDQSIVRTPPDSGAFVPHKTASPIEAPFSPGHAPKTPPESASKIPVIASITSLQVWPNPFNATTHLRFHLHQAASVHVAIYNVQGQHVRTLVDAPLHAGIHRTRWDGRDERGHSAATGPYFARFHIAHGPPRYAKLVLLR